MWKPVCDLFKCDESFVKYAVLKKLRLKYQTDILLMTYTCKRNVKLAGMSKRCPEQRAVEVVTGLVVKKYYSHYFYRKQIYRTAM
jgi:hypothetical protein